MRVVRRVLLALGVLVLAFALVVSFLLWRTADPRDAEGWARLSDLPGPRGEVASTVADGKLFLIGGLSGGFASATDRVDVYAPGSNEWSKAPPLPEARHHAAAAPLGRSLIVTGGSRTATDWAPEVDGWVLAPGGARWEPIEPLPEGRMGHQMVEVDGRVLAIGGRGGADVLIYEPGSGWSRGAPIPVPRDHLVAVVADGLVYAMGGRDDRIRSRVDVYDPVADVWSRGSELPRPMSAMAAGTLADGIHVVGGEDPGTLGGGVIDAHFVFDPFDRTWREAPRPIVATHGSGFGVIEGALVIAGGARRQGAFSVLGWTGLTQSFGA